MNLRRMDAPQYSLRPLCKRLAKIQSSYPVNLHVLRQVNSASLANQDTLPQGGFGNLIDLYDELIRDAERNSRICDDVIAAVREGRSPLVLTERDEHLDELASRLQPVIHNLIVLRGGMGKKQLQQIHSSLAAIPSGAERVLLATGRYVGEGFDDPRLDALFLTLPISWHGTIAQYVGRLHREHEGKREVRVYDYADLEVPMLARMFNRRCRGYESIGYTLLLPGSAVAGWPVDVPLPVDPIWKEQYAATIRRLIRDGVDTLLANLFVATARVFPPDAEGPTRARSAAEKFLFRRLESLPDLAGKFPVEFRATDFLRWLGKNGSRPVVPGIAPRNRIRRTTTFWRSGRIPTGSPERCIVAGERLLRFALLD